MDNNWFRCSVNSYHIFINTHISFQNPNDSLELLIDLNVLKKKQKLQ